MVGETHREGFILTARRTWHATCGIIASGAGRCLQTLERTLFTLGLCLASSSVRSCRSMFVQLVVDSEARMLRQSRETSLSCAVVADSDYGLATSVPGLSRHSRWAWYFVCSSVWHQHRLRQTGLISDTPWSCWVAEPKTVSGECAWRVVCTWPWRLNASSSSDPDLPTALSLHGATEQTMEEDGWLGRPTVRGSYSREAVPGMPRAAERESEVASALMGAVYWYRLVARDIAFAELMVPLSTCAVGEVECRLQASCLWLVRSAGDVKLCRGRWPGDKERAGTVEAACVSNRCTHPEFLQAASMGRQNKPWRRLGGWGDPP